MIVRAIVGETSLEGDLSLSDHRMGIAQHNDSFDTGTQEREFVAVDHGHC